MSRIGHKHASIHTGASDFISTSRSLAREILRRQLNSSEIIVLDFKSLEDPEWIAWYEKKRVSTLQDSRSKLN